MLIYMFLSPGSVDASEQLYTGQAFVQVFLLLLALICIPWMLCVKPYLEYKEHQKIVGQGYGMVGNGHGHGNGTRTSYDAEEEEAGHVTAPDADDEHVGDFPCQHLSHEDEWFALIICSDRYITGLRHGGHHHPSIYSHHRVCLGVHL